MNDGKLLFPPFQGIELESSGELGLPLPTSTVASLAPVVLNSVVITLSGCELESYTAPVYLDTSVQ